MWETIEKLRTLPLEKRTSVATLIAIGLTLVIFIPWFSFYGVNIISDHSDKQAVAQVVTPFSLIASETADVGETLKNSWGMASSMGGMITSALSGKKDTYIAPTSRLAQKQATTTPLRSESSAGQASKNIIP